MREIGEDEADIYYEEFSGDGGELMVKDYEARMLEAIEYQKGCGRT